MRRFLILEIELIAFIVLKEFKELIEKLAEFMEFMVEGNLLML